MEKELLTGENKIQQISKLLKEETLEPAKKEAQRIVDRANEDAKRIVAAAEKDAQEIVVKGQKELEKEKGVFHTSLKQGAAQAIESLRQQIQTKLFNEEFHQLVHRETVKPAVIADLIQAIVSALSKEGINTNLEAVIPKAVSVDEVNRLIGDEVLKKLQGGSVKVGSVAGGAQVKLIDKKLTLDMSDQALKELLSNFLRKDFRELLFQK